MGTQARSPAAARPLPALEALVRRWLDTPQFYLLVAIGGLTIGRLLTPDARGFGTHEALGLPPCTFRYVTGIPCPGCGMTTAVSHAAHGHFVDSFLTQPAGFLVGIALWAAVPVMLYALWTKRPLRSIIPPSPRHRLGWGIVAYPVLIGAWLYKVMTVLLG